MWYSHQKGHWLGSFIPVCFQGLDSLITLIGQLLFFFGPKIQNCAARNQIKKLNNQKAGGFLCVCVKNLCRHMYLNIHKFIDWKRKEWLAHNLSVFYMHVAPSGLSVFQIPMLRPTKTWKLVSGTQTNANFVSGSRGASSEKKTSYKLGVFWVVTVTSKLRPWA